MPIYLRPRYSEAERAVLAVIAGEIKGSGVCDLTIAAISNASAVKRSTIKDTLSKASDLGDIAIQSGHRDGRSNVIRIVSVEWLCWIAEGFGSPGSEPGASLQPGPARA